MRALEDRVLAVLTAYSILVLVLTPFPPMTDLPAHLATAVVLRDYAGTPLADSYVSLGWINSNRLFAWVASHTPRSLPLMVTGKCALLSWLLIPLIGRRFLRTWRPAAAPWAAVLFLLSFSNLFNNGYIPYLLGVPLALLAFALPWAAEERPSGWKLVAPAILLLLALYAHVLAFLAGAVGVAASCLTVRPSWRSWGSRALVILPAAALTAGIVAANTATVRAMAFAYHRHPLDSLSWVGQKLVSFGDNFISFRFNPEMVFYADALLVLLLLGVAGIIRTGWRELWRPAVIAGALAIAFLACPTQFMSGERSDGRLVPALLMAWTALLPGDGALSPRIRRIVLVAIALPPLLWANVNYARGSGVIARIDRALGAIPPERSVRLVFEINPLSHFERLAPLAHVHAYYMVEARGRAIGALIPHGTWHIVQEREETPPPDPYLLVLGARRARGLVSAEELVFDDGENMVLHGTGGPTLRAVVHPLHELHPGSARARLRAAERGAEFSGE